MNNGTAGYVNFLEEQKISILNGLQLLTQHLGLQVIKIDPHLGLLQGMLPFCHTCIMPRIGTAFMRDHWVHLIHAAFGGLSGVRVVFL